MRFKQIADWINRNSEAFYNEAYNPSKRYDIVVFVKMMTPQAQREAEKVRNYGGKIIFDANVNYYEIWGDYVVPGTKPTEEQQRQAIWMTRFCDLVVADSLYLSHVCRKFNPNVVWIPDNVNTEIYRGGKRHRSKHPVKVIWSGVCKKAKHFELIESCLYDFSKKIELILVTDKETASNRYPEVVFRLRKKLTCKIKKWKDRNYYKHLLNSDIIVSPKILNNGYEMGHTEYKIALGMAQQLPVVASNQPSYVDAIPNNEGGYICHSEEEWFQAFERLIENPELRQEMGEKARTRILERYSTPVIARQWLDCLRTLI